jgi:hypothetical protein
MMGDYLVWFGEGSNTKAFNMFMRKFHSIDRESKKERGQLEKRNAFYSLE